MPKTEGHKEYEKQKWAHIMREPVDHDEKKYSQIDMDSLEYTINKSWTISSIVLWVFFIVLIGFAFRH